MKMKLFVVLMMFALTASPAWAEIIRGIDIDFVTIGNPGNPGDTRNSTAPEDYDVATPYGCGAVGYRYRIGKYEVTNGQWNAFVTSAGAPTGNAEGSLPGEPMESAYDQSSFWPGVDIPVTGVSWYEAVQFCNYLTSGDKSKGAYLFNGNNADPGDFLGIDRASALSVYGTAYVLPTEDEWYKAAYYRPDGSGYSTCANGLLTLPPADEGWNYGAPHDQPWSVGSGAMEQNGTFDMMGNVGEWNEVSVANARGVRGGYYMDVGGYYLKSSGRGDTMPFFETEVTGFRIAAVPEPSCLVLLTLGGLVLRRWRR